MTAGELLQGMVGANYHNWLAAGIVSFVLFTTTSAEASQVTFIRFKHTQTWKTMLSTSLSLRNIVAGEVLWSATKGVIVAAIITILMVVLGVIELTLHFGLVLTLILVAGLCYGAIGVMAVSIIKSWHGITLFMFLWVAPSTMFSGFFLPLDGGSELLRPVVIVLPSALVTNVIRDLTLHNTIAVAKFSGVVGYLMFLTIVAFNISMRNFAKRVHN